MNWNLLFSTFGLIFVAELGDKTQLAVVTQTCKFRSPWSVFLGGSLALTAVTALGAVGGQILGSFIPLRVIQVIAGLAFILMGLIVWRESAKMRDIVECEVVENDCDGLGDSQVGAKRKSPFDKFGEHMVHCKEIHGFKYRHDLVRDVLFDVLRRVGAWDFGEEGSSSTFPYRSR